MLFCFSMHVPMVTVRDMIWADHAENEKRPEFPVKALSPRESINSKADSFNRSSVRRQKLRRAMPTYYLVHDSGLPRSSSLKLSLGTHTPAPASFLKLCCS